MSISAQDVASLRARTGVSMMQCKAALEEAGGDEEKAIEILRSKGVAQAAKKADREQTEGLVFSASKGSKAVLVKVHCETDFVARDENFQQLGNDLATTLLASGEDALKAEAEKRLPDAVQKLGENISLGDHKVIEAPVIGAYVHGNAKIGVVVGLDGGDEAKAKDAAMHAAAMNPQYVHPEDVPAEEVEKEKAIWSQQLKDEGKPEEIVEKIMQGKEKKFREEVSLTTQEFVKEPGQTVGQYLGDATVSAYERFAIG